MARWRMAATFALTLGVLTLIVALSLRQARAQSDPPTQDTTLVAYHPVASLAKGENALVHIVNLGRDLFSAPEVFRVMFIDPQGLLLGTEQRCDIRPGETCSVPLDIKSCPPAAKQLCVFRAVVVGQPQPCTTPDTGTGEWMTNLEVFATAKYIAGETGVLKLPTDGCTPSPDQAQVPDISSPDAPAFPDAPVGFPDAPVGFPDAPVSFPDAPVSFPDAPVSFPDAPVSFPDAPVSFPDAPVSFPDAPVSFPDAPVSFPDAPVSFPDAPG